MNSILFFIFFVPVLSFILLFVNFGLAPHKPYKEKKTPFECGYHSYIQTRMPFAVVFFIFGMLFLLFDIEIVLIVPFATTSYLSGGFAFYSVIAFVLILTLGFVFELGKNALKIDTKEQKYQ